jgi:hypothetical protein
MMQKGKPMKRTLTCRLAGLAALVWLLILPVSMRAQNASPLGGAPLQLFDNTGALLTSGMIYSYVGGTSTPVAVYVDGSATNQQPNPTPFGSGARVSLFYLNGTFVKIVICSSNTDGSSCAAGDILATMDMIPIGSSASSGNTGTFTGLFISGTASPATSGALRVASGDSICWRNAAGSTNLCFKKDSNDLVSWDGGSLKLPEVGAPTGVLGFDILWADNTAHRLKAVNNGGTAAQYVLSGNDIGTTDQVSGIHFGATQETLCSTAPTANQFLQFTGTCIGGTTLPTAESQMLFACGGCVTGGIVEESQLRKILVSAHTLTRFTVALLGTGGAGCTTQAIVALWDATAASSITTLTTSNGTAFYDSGVLSIALTAGHTFDVKITQASSGCGTSPQLADSTANYQ